MSSPSPQQPSRAIQSPAIGIVFSIFAAGCTTTVDAFAKLLANELNGLIVVWGYTLGILALLTPYLAIKCIRGVPARQLLISRRWPLHLVRAGCLIGSIATSFVALAYIPLIDATTVMFMSPLFVNLLASPLLGERVGLHRWLGVLIGLAGVLIIIQPGTVTFHWATLLAVLSAMFFAMFQVITRRLAPEENTLTMLFLTAVGGVIWSSCLVVFVWQPLDLRDAAIFLGLGALGVAAHFSHIKAFAHAQVSLLAPFTYVKILWASALGFVLFNHLPTVTVLTGAVLVIGGGLYVFVTDRRPEPN